MTTPPCYIAEKQGITSCEVCYAKLTCKIYRELQATDELLKIKA